MLQAEGSAWIARVSRMISSERPGTSSALYEAWQALYEGCMRAAMGRLQGCACAHGAWLFTTQHDAWRRVRTWHVEAGAHMAHAFTTRAPIGGLHIHMNIPGARRVVCCLCCSMP